MINDTLAAIVLASLTEPLIPGPLSGLYLAFAAFQGLAAITKDAHILGSLIQPGPRLREYLLATYHRDPPEFLESVAVQIEAVIKRAAR